MYQVGKPLGKPTLPDWGLMISEMRNMLQLLTCFPTLVLFTAHQEPIQIGDEVRLHVKALGQKLGAELPGMFDEVWQMKIKRKSPDVQYMVSWKPSGFVEVRTRSGRLSEYIINDIGLTGLLKEVNYNYSNEKGD